MIFGRRIEGVINAMIYARDGRRIPARVEICGGTRTDAGAEFVFCEATMASALGEVYTGCARQPERAAHLYGTDEVRPCGTDAAGLGIKPADSPALIRGIYALACQTRPSFARETRAIWQGLMARWTAAGLEAYFIMRGERAQGYMLLGGRDGQGEFTELREFAALPDSGVTLAAALSAARAAGLCGDEVAVHGSIMEVDE